MTTINGDWIRDMRKRLGLNQAQFARRVGVSQGLVSLWEADVRSPTGPALIVLRYLAVEADQVSGEKISA